MKEGGRKHGAMSPCAACKLLRRRCAQDCLFAPYFPADEPHKFASVHKVFGASNVNKMLQVQLPPLTHIILLFSLINYKRCSNFVLIQVISTSSCDVINKSLLCMKNN